LLIPRGRPLLRNCVAIFSLSKDTNLSKLGIDPRRAQNILDLVGYYPLFQKHCALF
jgi:hypothetical protein